MRLFLVRHGETDYNKQKRYQGRIDTALNKTGLRQAKALQRRLSTEEIYKIYTSRLMRAKDTSRIIALGRNIEVISLESLAEMDFGGFEGLTYEEIIARHPRWRPDSFDFTACGGESLEHLARRMGIFIEEIGRNPAGSNIMVVGHAGCLRVLVCLLLGIGIENWWRFALDPASLTIMDSVAEAPVLIRLNDVSHLKIEG